MRLSSGIPVLAGNQLEKESSFDDNNDQVDSFQNSTHSQFDNDQVDSRINSNLNEISINKMFELEKADKYPKKIVIKDNVECKFTSILNFFKFADQFDTFPTTNFKFDCKICKKLGSVD